MFFSSDCFGGLLSAVPEKASDIDGAELRAGQVRWAAIDSPWIHGIDRDVFGRTLDDIRSIEPSMVCRPTSRRRPARSSNDFVDALATVPYSERFGRQRPARAAAGLDGLEGLLDL